MNRTMIAAVIAAAFVCTAAGPPTPKPPASPKRPVEDKYFDTVVKDDYRWLENASSPEVRQWVKDQNAATRAFLDKLPDHAAIQERVTALTHNTSPAYHDLRWVHGTTFALKEQPPKQQRLLVRLGSVDDMKGESVLLDPNQLDPSGSTAIDFFEPSPDGSKVAVSLSRGGTESGTVHVIDVHTGTALADTVPRVNGGTAGGSVAWSANGQGFYRTRYSAEGERPADDLPFFQQLYYHRLGTDAAQDRYVIGREFPKIAEIVLSSSKDGRFTLADVLNGDGGEHALYLAGPDGQFRQLTRFEDQVVQGRFGEGALYLMSRKDTPNGRILRMALPDGDLAHATEVVPEGGTAIEDFTPAHSVLYVQDMVGGPSQIRVVGLDGKPRGAVSLPPVSSVRDMVLTEGDQVLIERESFTEPPAWWRYEPAKGRLEPTALAMRSPASFSDIEVRRDTAVSKDGTRVPLTILMRKGTKLDGTAPAMLFGYGGFGISTRPAFSPARRVWFDHGVIVAVANIRGGGEFGEAWHRGGNLTHKQNVFDDFAACGRRLVERRYTSPDRLGCLGGSNGGLLMGAMITQQPALFRVVVASVGIYDMLRVEHWPNGAFNVTEYGTVKDPEQFRALMAYSPYQHVQNGTRYPAVLFLTGENDPRVDPSNSRKMTAGLQAASASGRPVLLRVSFTTGHGIDSPLAERNRQTADMYSFALSQIGVAQKPVTVPSP